MIDISANCGVHNKSLYILSIELQALNISGQYSISNDLAMALLKNLEY